MAWTTAANVRTVTGLTTSDISDTDLNSLIASAQKEVLMYINVKVIREQVKYIDETRQNEIDGENTTYYVENWEGKFFSDYDFDLDVDTDDVSVFLVSTSDGTETEATVSSIDYTKCQFTLDSAPDDVDMYVTYVYSSFDPVIPDAILKLATEYLAGAYAYMRIDGSQKKKVKFGNTEITNGTGEQSAYWFFYQRYLDLIKQLNNSDNGGAVWGVSEVLI